MKYLVLIYAPGDHDHMYLSVLRRALQKGIDADPALAIGRPQVVTVGKVNPRTAVKKAKVKAL